MNGNIYSASIAPSVGESPIGTYKIILAPTFSFYQPGFKFRGISFFVNFETAAGEFTDVTQDVIVQLGDLQQNNNVDQANTPDLVFSLQGNGRNQDSMGRGDNLFMGSQLTVNLLYGQTAAFVGTEVFFYGVTIYYEMPF